MQPIVWTRVKNKIPSKSFIIPNSYSIPCHNQGNKMNCTSHAYALMIEYKLSDYFGERTLIDVDDLWEKQKKYGTASEIHGDFLKGPFIIGEKYGVLFTTASGKTGVYYPGQRIKVDTWFDRLLKLVKNFSL